MRKKTTHRYNLMSRNSAVGCSSMQFVCRGCTMRNRENLWHGFLSSVTNVIDREFEDNSYFFFEEEPSNEYDSNAIKVLVGGEFFGLVGYVGREFTLEIKDILNRCNQYRIDMVDESVVEKENKLILTYMCDNKKR